MLTALLQQTARPSDGKHRVVVAKDGVLLPLAPAHITLPDLWPQPARDYKCRTNSMDGNFHMPDINEVYVVNESEGKEILLKGKSNQPNAYW